MPLPIIVIFERHWDKTPKKILKQLIPILSKRGYNTLCYEGPEDLIPYNFHITRIDESIEFAKKRYSEASECLGARNINVEELSDLDFGVLDKLMLNFVSTKHHQLFAEQIKNLPGALIFKEILEESKNSQMSVVGVDVESQRYDEMLSNSWLTENMFSNRVVSLDKVEVQRNETLSRNLTKLYQEEKNIVFICGAFHAEKIISYLKEKHGENSVIYYFICSDKQYDKTFDDIKFAINNNPILTLHTVYPGSEEEINQFNQNLTEEINFKSANFQQNISIKKIYPTFKFNFDRAAEKEIKDIENWVRYTRN